MQHRKHSMNSSTGKAFAYIRDAILSGRLPAGSSLPTTNLAEEIGVSRTPVRDALRQLETQGLVTIAPRQEARVNELTIEEDKAIGEIQIALEAYAAQLAALRRTNEDLERIRHFCTTLAELAARPSPQTAEESEGLVRLVDSADASFHIAIMNTARNGQVKSEILRLLLIRSLTPVPRSLRTWQHNAGLHPQRESGHSLDDMLEAHEKILHAIEAQSAEGAYAAMRDHLESSFRRRLRALKTIRDQEMQRALGQSLLYQG